MSDNRLTRKDWDFVKREIGFVDRSSRVNAPGYDGFRRRGPYELFDPAIPARVRLTDGTVIENAILWFSDAPPEALDDSWFSGARVAEVAESRLGLTLDVRSRLALDVSERRVYHLSGGRSGRVYQFFGEEPFDAIFFLNGEDEGRDMRWGAGASSEILAYASNAESATVAAPEQTVDARRQDKFDVRFVWCRWGPREP